MLCCAKSRMSASESDAARRSRPCALARSAGCAAISAQPHAVDHVARSSSVVEVVVQDPRLGVRHAAAQRAPVRGWSAEQRGPMVKPWSRDAEELLVQTARRRSGTARRARRGRRGCGERAALADVGRQRPAALALESARFSGVIADAGSARRSGQTKSASGGPGGSCRPAGRRRPRSQRRELVGGPDAREHQQLRRVVRAGAEDDLALGADFSSAPSRMHSTPTARSPSNRIRWPAHRSAHRRCRARPPGAGRRRPCCSAGRRAG